MFVSAITLLPLFWRGCEARARGQIYLHLLEPAVKLCLKIDALDRLWNPHLEFLIYLKISGKISSSQQVSQPRVKKLKLTQQTVRPTPWKLLTRPAVTKEDIAYLLQAKPKDLKRALHLDKHRV